MPGSVRVSVLEVVELPLALVGRTVQVRVALGKKEYKTKAVRAHGGRTPPWNADFAFPVLNLRDKLSVLIVGSNGETMTKAEIEVASVVQKGFRDEMVALQGGGRIHLKLSFVLSEEERRRIEAMRVSKKVQVAQPSPAAAEVIADDGTCPKPASLTITELPAEVAKDHAVIRAVEQKEPGLKAVEDDSSSKAKNMSQQGEMIQESNVGGVEDLSKTQSDGHVIPQPENGLQPNMAQVEDKEEVQKPQKVEDVGLENGLQVNVAQEKEEMLRPHKDGGVGLENGLHENGTLEEEEEGEMQKPHKDGGVGLENGLHENRRLEEEEEAGSLPWEDLGLENGFHGSEGHEVDVSRSRPQVNGDVYWEGDGVEEEVGTEEEDADVSRTQEEDWKGRLSAEGGWQSLLSLGEEDLEQLSQSEQMNELWSITSEEESRMVDLLAFEGSEAFTFELDVPQSETKGRLQFEDKDIIAVTRTKEKPTSGMAEDAKAQIHVEAAAAAEPHSSFLHQIQAIKSRWEECEEAAPEDEAVRHEEQVTSTPVSNANNTGSSLVGLFGHFIAGAVMVAGAAFLWSSASRKYHVVAEGETFKSLAPSHQSASSFCKLNPGVCQSKKVYPGQRIRLS